LSKILFITGTDTGVGKTLLTACVLMALRRNGVRALAMKPFCSGGWQDVDLIQQIQGKTPSRQVLAPFYFPEPLAPLPAARQRRHRIQLGAVKRAIASVARRCDRLIVEGAGGVLVPIGPSGSGSAFTVADVIAALNCDVVVVAPNRLGVLNHTCLTVEALRARGVQRIAVVLMGQRRKDLSTRTNGNLLRELLRGTEVLEFPFLGRKTKIFEGLEQSSKKIEKVLAWIGSPDSFCARLRNRPETSEGPKRLKDEKRSLTVVATESQTDGRNNE
jgi:dethiobiotin synthetase